MKTHTSGFKNAIKTLGREIDVKLTYNSTTITAENINSVSLHYEGAILKSVMKQLDLDLNVNIPLETILTAQFGLKVNGAYEYITLGDFVVYKSEKQEDTRSYKITCYDKMLYAMKDYESLAITYPITIRNYLSAICTKLGLTFANASSTFTNYDKTIPNELYLDVDSNSIGYTFRDVLDELAEVTASTICINDSGNLEIRYINETSDTIDEEFLKDVNVNFGEVYGPINTVVLTRAEADKISQSIPSDLADEDKIAIEIKENQIMNFNDRADYLSEILTKLNGLTYCLNDFVSTGITYYDLCDKYSVSIDGNTYTCIMFNDEINISNGLTENIYTEMLDQAEVEYKHTTTDDRISRVQLSVNKQENKIEAIVDEINGENGIQAQLTSQKLTIETKTKNIDDEGNITTVKNTIGTFDTNGLTIEDGETHFKSTLSPTATQYKDSNNEVISETSKDGVMAKDFKQRGLHQYSWNGSSYDFSDERIEINSEYGYATFYNGDVE